MSTFRSARAARASAARHIRKPLRTRLWLKWLEERIAPAVLNVTDPGDNGGSGQLRAQWAIASSNAEPDTITFGSSVTTINLTSVLPVYAENQPLTITGNG